MKVVSTEALTKLIQLVKSAFISVDDTVQTSEVDVYTKNEVDNLTLGGNLYGDVVVDNEFLCMNYTCVKNKFITSFSAPNCTRASFRGTFAGCINLITLDLPALRSIDADPNWYEEYGYNDDQILCNHCDRLTTVNLNSLDDLSTTPFALSKAFCYCPLLSSLSFPALKSTSFGSFAVKRQFYGMLEGCENVTVHFPSNLQSVIGNWEDVVNGFSGTNTTILFDLPATE